MSIKIIGKPPKRFSETWLRQNMHASNFTKSSLQYSCGVPNLQQIENLGT